MVPQIHLHQQGLDLRATGHAIREALQQRQMIQQVQRRQSGIDAEILGQVAQSSTMRRCILENRFAVEQASPRIRRLQRRENPHQRRLAGAVGSEQPK
jgi:hypothetical protein